MIEIPKEVADGIVQLRNLDFTDFQIIKEVETFKNISNIVKTTYQPMVEWAKQHPKPFMRALADGYTVKQEPITVTITAEQQDVLKGFYVDRVDDYKLAIRKSLNILGIKIKGVND